MIMQGCRCAPGLAAVGLLVTAGTTFGDVPPAGITINSNRAVFERSIITPKVVDFDTPDDAFGHRLNDGAVLRLGLKFTAAGPVRDDTDVQIVEERLSLLLSNQTARIVSIDLGRQVTAFGAFFKDPLVVPGVMISVGGRTMRLSDLPDIRDGGGVFAGVVSDTPFDAISIMYPPDGPASNRKAVVLDDFVFGNIPAPGAACLVACATAWLGARRRRS